MQPRPRTTLNIGSLIDKPFDSIVPSSYTADHQPQLVEYKQGGVTVVTLTISYTGGAAGGDIISIIRS